MLRALMCLCVALAFGPEPVAAQQTVLVQGISEDRSGPRLSVKSPILTVNSERLFSDSVPGRQVIDEIEAASLALQARNDEIAAELQAEEQMLTDLRPDMTPEEFRVLADAFDEKAQSIRQERANALRVLNDRMDAERRTFLQSTAPILEDIMREAGAAVVLEQRDVLIASIAIDITQLAIARIDAGFAATETPPVE